MKPTGKQVLRGQIAASLGVPASTLVILPEMFAKVRVFGTSPRRVVGWLREVGIGHKDLVLDVGCGLGGVIVPVVKQLKCRGIGVDGCDEFVRAAREYAGDLPDCKFIACDFAHAKRKLNGEIPNVILYLSVMPLASAVAHARAILGERGGYIIVDDAIERYGNFTRESARGIMADAKIVREYIETPSRTNARMRRLYAELQRSAANVAKRGKNARRLAGLVLERHREAAEILCTQLRPAIWLIRV